MKIWETNGPQVILDGLPCPPEDLKDNPFDAVWRFVESYQCYDNTHFMSVHQFNSGKFYAFGLETDTPGTFILFCPSDSYVGAFELDGFLGQIEPVLQMWQPLLYTLQTSGWDDFIDNLGQLIDLDQVTPEYQS